MEVRAVKKAKLRKLLQSVEKRGPTTWQAKHPEYVRWIDDALELMDKDPEVPTISMQALARLGKQEFGDTFPGITSIRMFLAHHRTAIRSRIWP